MLKIIPLMFCAAALAGCATAEQIAATDNAKCSGYGFTKGTDSFAQCRLAVDAEREQQRAARKAAFAGLAANSMNAASQGYYAASAQAQTNALAYQQPTRTNCAWSAGTLGCTSY